MTTEVFTVATQATEGLTRLQTSLSKFGVPITILGQGEQQFWGLGWKWKTLIRAARASSVDTVLFCDAYDSMCLDSLTSIANKFASLGHKILFSYESQSQPEYWLGLNCGLVMADRKTILGLFDERTIDDFMPNHFIDQDLIQSLYARSPDAFALDTEGRLFHTVGARSVELVEKDNQLVNPITGYAPSFVHAPYGRDLSKIEAWLSAAT